MSSFCLLHFLFLSFIECLAFILAFSFLLLSPGCSLPLPPSLSLCLYMSFFFFLPLALFCLLPHTHPLTLSLSPLLLPLPLLCVCLSLSLPPSLLPTPSFSLSLLHSPFTLHFLLFFLFFLSLLPFTRLLHALSSHSLTLFPASLPPSLHLCLCFCSHSALQCFCLILCFSILFSFLNLAQFSFFSFLSSFLHLNVCLCGDQ